MVRFGRFKYVYYQGHRPQLFDLDADPFETRDLAREQGMDVVLAEAESRLRAICDPAQVTERAFTDQRAKIEASGGKEAVLNLGSFAYTPAPGEEPKILGAT